MFVALLQIYVTDLDCTRTWNAFDHILKENVEAKNIFIFSVLEAVPVDLEFN